jgi:uncharacterized protein YjlB
VSHAPWSAFYGGAQFSLPLLHALIPPQEFALLDSLVNGDTKHDKVVRNVAAVKLPDADPVSGAKVPLMRVWSS